MPIAIKDSTIDITSEKLTKELAKEFTKYLKGGEFVFLYGEMGVGKTTFVKYFINEYQKINNLTQTEITSPTFSLLNEYQVCLLYTSPSPRDATLSRMPSSA